MHFDLNDELKELRDRARRFVEEELIPHELEVDEHSRVPEAASAGAAKTRDTIRSSV